MVAIENVDCYSPKMGGTSQVVYYRTEANSAASPDRFWDYSSIPSSTAVEAGVAVNVSISVHRAAMPAADAIARSVLKSLFLARASRRTLPSIVVFQPEFARVQALRDDWDTYGSPAPTRDSVQRAQDALGLALEAGLAPSRVVPMSDGGTALSFRAADRYADLAFLNEGGAEMATIAPGTTMATEPIEEDLAGLRDAIRKVAAHLKA